MDSHLETELEDADPDRGRLPRVSTRGVSPPDDKAERVARLVKVQKSRKGRIRAGVQP